MRFRVTAVGGVMPFKQFALAISLMGLIACGTAPIKPDPKPDPQPELGASSEVSGQVLDWPQGRVDVVRAIVSNLDNNFAKLVIGQGSIDSKGKLALRLVNAPSASFLKRYEICGIDTEANGIEITLDVAEKGLEANPDKPAAILGQVNDNAQVMYVFVDRNLEVDGKCTDGQVSAKLSLKKGWNVVLASFTQPGSTGAMYSSAAGVAGVPFQIKLKLGSSWE
jgi:hypothetical protein